MLNFHFGGGGKGRGRRGGLVKRLAGLAFRGVQEMRGKPTTGKPLGGKGSSANPGRSFADFQQDRPDLFEVDDIDDQGDDDQENDTMPETTSPYTALAEAIAGRDADAADDSHVVAGQRRPRHVPFAEGPTYGPKDVCDFCQGVHGHHWHGCVRGPGGAR
jgi:hypothetical protein